MSAPDPSKKLHALIKRLRARHPEPAPSITPPWDGAEPLVGELVFSMLLADSTTAVASRNFHQLQDAFVDANDLRIALAREIAEHLEEADPQRHERAARIKAALMEVYQREHTTSLASLVDAGKRETKQYLETLSGATPFVVARVKLMCLSGWCVPVDDRLLNNLHAEGALSAGATCVSASEWLPKQFEPDQPLGHPLALHGLFQAWADEEAPASKASKVERTKVTSEAKEPKSKAVKRSKKAKSS